VRPRSITNELVPGPELPPWARFERLVGMIVKVPKEEADHVDKAKASTGRIGATGKRNISTKASNGRRTTE